MVALDVVMAPSQSAQSWALEDVGQLGPAVRLGWFIPRRTEQASPLYDHWKVLRDPTYLTTFSPTATQQHFLREKVKKNNDRSVVHNNIQYQHFSYVLSTTIS